MDYKKLNAIVYALLAALFYAINIPCSKLLLNNVSPTFMASVLYLGAGFGVGIIYSKNNDSRVCCIWTQHIYVHQSAEDSGSSKDKRLLCNRSVYWCGSVSCIPERKIHNDVYHCAHNNARRDCPYRQRYIDT